MSKKFLSKMLLNRNIMLYNNNNKLNILIKAKRFFAKSTSEHSVKQKDINTFLSNSPYGQPTFETHPHLINNGELVPGLKLIEFKDRRFRLMNSIKKYAKDSNKKDELANRNHLVIIPSANKKYMSDHIPYVFRQNSNFYYLTGCLEQDTILTMFIDERSCMKSTLYIRPKNDHAELWDGARTGVERAADFFGVDEAYPIDMFSSIVQSRVQSMRPQIWYENNTEENCKVKLNIQTIAKVCSSSIYSPTTFIESLRLFKSPAEQSLMRKTCSIASKSINEVIRMSKPGLSEHHIFAMVDYLCRMYNASYLAYPPVVASGRNTTTIHYINNSQITKTGDLILLDAGCEYGGYTSDITRTWPICGTFSGPQRELYELVLTLHKELIEILLKEGGDTLDNLFETMCIKLGKYMQEVGLADKSVESDQELCKIGFKFCPHHVSHYLGMDVHDTPLMPRSLKLLPGMIFTVEPGVYISHNNKEVPKEFRGFGIRIEDDVLVTKDNQIEVLTQSCIKDIDDLENAFKEK